MQKRLEIRCGSDLTLACVHIEPGRFIMGSPSDEPHRCPGWWSQDETPHQVTLTKGYYLSETVVTQEQWKAVMGFNTYDEPSRGVFFGNGHEQKWRIDYPGDIGPRKPAVGLTRAEAIRFCEKLSSANNRVCRLPTEAQWEYACRAGSTTPFYYGDDAGQLDKYAIYGRQYGNNEEVATRLPNAWGLYDMHGNVWEWVLDYWGEFPSKPQVDPAGPPAPPVKEPQWERVMRGGCSVNDAWQQRSACRHRIEENFRNSVVGFRVLVEE